MENFRTYGKPPFVAALLHGGPGVSGEMAPVARELSSARGILEPFQTRDTIAGQLEELKLLLEEMASIPAVLVGYSWGAWLGYLFAARYPGLVRKLILVSSGPFEDRYAAQIEATRSHRLSKEERKQFESLRGKLENPLAFSRYGELLSRTDFYEPLPMKPAEIELRPEIYKSVWAEASALRQSGALLEAGKDIRCPVLAIHGDHDPHPAAGVEKPLASRLRDFRFILLEKCGHNPWLEKHARDEFFRILNEELG